MEKKVLYACFKRSFIAIAIYSYNPFAKQHLWQTQMFRLSQQKVSTIFYISKNNESVKILGSKDDYKKILMKDDQIGWVK